MNKYFFIFSLIFFFAFSSQDISLPTSEEPKTDQISIPLLLNYQGKLTDNIGNPVPDSNYSVTFRLFTVPSGGTSFWSETQTIQTRGGLFHVLLGSVNPITSLPLDGNCYLEMQVNPNPPMTPRIRIVSVGYAYIAKRADTANYAQTASLTRPITPPIATNEIADGAVTSAKIQDGTIVGADINQMGASVGQVLKWTGSTWAPGNDSIGGAADNAWVRGTPDSVLYTIRQLGIARSGNMLYGNGRFTHINLGVACTTGRSGQNDYYCTVGGGRNNTASGGSATVGGGEDNTASGGAATVGGGYYNTASGNYGATVGGGDHNTASGTAATVGGGENNTASGGSATVGGGEDNTASGGAATVGGGYGNTASGYAATVAGGDADTSAGNYSFTTNYHSKVPAGLVNSAAFNGELATASNQLRCGMISKASGSFTIDHPLDPYNKILNHYFIEGPEMRNLYDGEVILDASGRATVYLPEYFSALNRKPRIQLTGVGTSDVYVAEDIKDNTFVIGGKPGTKVYWQVTGERQDVSAEATRRLMPVEQLKTGELSGRMLDDDFLVGCMEQLEREGKASGINFRTAEGRRRYEEMKNLLKKLELEREMRK